MWTGDVFPITPQVSDGHGGFTPKPGYSVTTTTEILAATPAAAPYRVAPPLNNVLAGDDPNSPTMTVELCFPDQATAQTVLAAYWTADSAN